jgi:hypothetical protein
MDIIKLKIDLSTMVFEFEGSADFAREALADFLAAKPHKLKMGTDPIENETEETESEEEGAKESKATAKPIKKRYPGKPESYTILPDLDLVGKSKDRPSLKDLYNDKGGAKLTSYEAVSVFVHYLTRLMNEENVGLSHLYSCYKHVGLRVPASLKQLMYDQKKRQHFINILKLNDLKLTVNGENLVDHDLPRKEKPAK